MTENLALGSTTQTYTLTSVDTNLPEGETFTLPVASTFGTTDWDTGTDENPKTALKINSIAGAEYGNQYNWYTALGGHIVYGDYAMSNYSICPLGWKLPPDNLSYSDSSYNLYIATYGFTLGWPATITEAEYKKYLDPPFSRDQMGGYITESGFNSYNEVSSFWTSQRGRAYQSQDDRAKHPYVWRSGGTYRANPSGVIYPTWGDSIRCVSV